LRGIWSTSDEEGLRELLKMAGYSEKAIDYYIKKRNVGVIEGAEAAESHTGLCGDSMRVYLKIKKGRITDAKFQAVGCAGAFASGSALTEMVKGKTLIDAERITEQDVASDLEKLPGPKLHCVRLAVDALRKSIASCKELQDSKTDGKCNTR
jgi:nitrogen fixation protein NifU and related proteins